MIKILYNSLKVLQGYVASQTNTLTYVLKDFVTPGGSSVLNGIDYSMTSSWSAGTFKGGTVSPSSNPTGGAVSYSSDDNGLIVDSITGDYFINYANSKLNTTRKVTVKSETSPDLFIPVPASLNDVVASFSNFQFEAGSVGRHIQDYFEGRVAGNPTPNDPITNGIYASLSYVDMTQLSAVRNTSSFFADLDISGVSFARTDTGIGGDSTFLGGNAVMVNSRFGLGADHYAPAIGDKCSFVKNDNTIQIVTCVNRKLINNSNYLCFFDADVLDVSYHEVMSSDIYERYMPSAGLEFSDAPHNAGFVYPGLSLVKHNFTGGNIISGTGGYGVLQGTSYRVSIRDQDSVGPIPITKLMPYDYGNFVGGDSGTPVFYPINGKAVFVGGATNVGTYNPVALNVADITAEMDLMSNTSGVYVLTYPDMSGFKDYSL